MSLHLNSFYSESLGRTVNVNVLLPELSEAKLAQQQSFPTIWLLHGLNDDASAWIRKSNLEILLDKNHPYAVVMPQTERGFYNNIPDGQQYFDFITTELVNKMRFIFPLSDDPKQNILMGNSMGGYGALRWGLTYPEQFAGVAAFSPAVDLTKFSSEQQDILPEFNTIFKNQDLTNSAVSIDYLLKNLSSDAANQLKIFMSTGSEDFLREMDVEYKAKFRKVFHTNFTWEESHGRHDWPMWNQQLPLALDWVSDVLGD